jgi:hypothetical protein
MAVRWGHLTAHTSPPFIPPYYSVGGKVGTAISIIIGMAVPFYLQFQKKVLTLIKLECIFSGTINSLTSFLMLDI